MRSSPPLRRNPAYQRNQPLIFSPLSNSECSDKHTLPPWVGSDRRICWGAMLHLFWGSSTRCGHCRSYCHAVSYRVSRLSFLRCICRPLADRTANCRDDRGACGRQRYEGISRCILPFRRLRAIGRYLARGKQGGRGRERLHRLHFIISRRWSHDSNEAQAKRSQRCYADLNGASGGHVFRQSFFFLAQLMVMQRDRRNDHRRRRATRGRRSQTGCFFCVIFGRCSRGAS